MLNVEEIHISRLHTWLQPGSSYHPTLVSYVLFIEHNHTLLNQHIGLLVGV
jgi:hypothetical protein